MEYFVPYIYLFIYLMCIS